MLRKALAVLLLVTVLSGCDTSARDQSNTPQANHAGQVQSASVVAPASKQLSTQSTAVPPTAEQAVSTPTKAITLPTSTQASEVIATQTAAPVDPDLSAIQPAASVPQASGPDTFSEGINPLTGLPVKDKSTLSLEPALVSITNFPVSARPQAGLSYSPYVFEMYIGEGMTRFLAVFYGDYPEKAKENPGSKIALDDDRIGPIRSGRLPYESLRKLYNGFLVMASASPNVLTSLSSYNTIFGSDGTDINSALIPANKLEEIASKNPDRVKAGALTGQKFDPNAPPNGKDGKMIWIPFSFLNQVIWRYDAAAGAYLRFQDQADGKTFVQMTDRLNKEPLTYENVVILFANHDAQRETLINIDLEYINKMPALLFRDGKMYQIYWTTANTDFEKKTGLERPIRFVDAQGNPFPLKPGQTWVEMVQSYTRYNETVDSKNYFEMKNKETPGSGNWVIHFFPTVAQR